MDGILVWSDVLLTATGKQTAKEMKTKAANNKTFMVSLFFFFLKKLRVGRAEGDDKGWARGKKKVLVVTELMNGFEKISKIENVGFILSKTRVEWIGLECRYILSQDRVE